MPCSCETSWKPDFGLFDLSNTIYTCTESISDIFPNVELLTFELSINWELKIRYFISHKVDYDNKTGFIECMMFTEYLRK